MGKKFIESLISAVLKQVDKKLQDVVSIVNEHSITLQELNNLINMIHDEVKDQEQYNEELLQLKMKLESRFVGLPQRPEVAD